MKNKKYSVLLIATFLICLLCFFLPDAKAQELKFARGNNIGIATTLSSYHIIIKNSDSTYTDNNIFVNINGVDKNITELNVAELRDAIRYILKSWQEETKRQNDFQNKLYDILNGKKKGKK